MNYTAAPSNLCALNLCDDLYPTIKIGMYAVHPSNRLGVIINAGLPAPLCCGRARIPASYNLSCYLPSLDSLKLQFDTRNIVSGKKVIL
ncbi:hypothetical protein [Streptococcus hyointestinalis]|uniref:hypothetical protein n=1 Tax=Streptococcus hyointestinalis TaxID=1337 RepID=UPI0013DEA1C5|nr:hypothetical protein [Streptococcus hyointestinalis]